MMCGIALSVGSGKPITSHKIAHRGPDQIYELIDDQVKICFARLAITGIAEGEMPVRSKDLSWEIFLNGEIYNKEQIQVKYELVPSSSDTATVAEGIAKYGIKILKDLRGMYSLVCFNRLTNEIFIARDPLGEKPLYIHNNQGTIYIASEIRSLMEHLSELKINPLAISSYFRFGYVEEPNTIFSGIAPIPKGQVSRVDRSSGCLEKVFSIQGFNEEEIHAELGELLALVASEGIAREVNSGLALSSGIDSNALLCAYSNTNLRALIVDFPQFGHSSEAHLAKTFARNVKVEYEVIEIEENEFASNLTQLIDAYDQPHWDPAGFSYFKIFQRAKDLGLKVVHLGHGPDEFFWGYDWVVDQLRQVNSKSFFGKNNNRLNCQSNTYWITPAMSGLFPNLIPELQFSIRNYKLSENDSFLESPNIYQRFRAEEVHSYLSHNAFQQADKLSMRFGVEARTIWADSRIYGWSQLNSNFLRKHQNKVQFKSAARNVFSSHVASKKLGFRNPLMNALSKYQEATNLTTEALDFLSELFKEKIRETEINDLDRYRLIVLAHWLMQNNCKL